MEPLPLPLRLAAGLVATAIEEVQGLPKKLIELPVTAISQVLQTSMRMQQKVTELAIKGDQALGGLRDVPETPTWARFDEDELDEPFGGANGFAEPTFDEDWDLPRPGARSVSPILVTRDREPTPATIPSPAESPEATTPPASPASPASPAAPTKPAGKTAGSPDRTAGTPGREAGIAGSAASDPTGQAAARTDQPAGPAGEPAGPAGGKGATSTGTTANATGKATSRSTAKTTSTTTAKGSSAETKAPATDRSATSSAAETSGNAATSADTGDAGGGDPGGPAGFEDYGTWTLPQLRGRFRSMSLEQVQALLDWETSHRDRPPYVTMLSNRAASITGR